MKYKLKITNETHWRTSDVKKILKLCIEHEGMNDTNRTFYVRIYYTKRRNDVMGYAWYNSSRFRIGLPRKIVRREDTDRQNGWYATSPRDIGGEIKQSAGWYQDKTGIPEGATDIRPCFLMKEVWGDVDELPASVVKRCADVTIHELAHCRGLKHGDMTCGGYDLSFLPSGLRIRKQAKYIDKEQTSEERSLAKEAKARTTVERLEGCIDEEKRRHKTNIKRLRTLVAKAKRTVYYYSRKAANKR